MAVDVFVTDGGIPCGCMQQAGHNSIVYSADMLEWTAYSVRSLGSVPHGMPCN